MDILQAYSRVDNQHPTPHCLAHLLMDSEGPSGTGRIPANPELHLTPQMVSTSGHPAQHSDDPYGRGGGDFSPPTSRILW